MRTHPEAARNKALEGERSMTTFGLVAGGGHNAWCWDRVVPELEQRGHQVVAVDLPTGQAGAGLTEFSAAVVDALAGVTGDIVLVGHSLAGRYLPLAAGQIPGSRMIFLCALIAEEATADAPAGVDPGGPPPGGGRGLIDDQGRLYFTPEVAAAAFYSDCDEETTSWAVAHLSPQGLKVIREPLPQGSWPAGVRAAYILCKEDAVIAPERAREMALNRVGVEPIELPGGHSPFLSQTIALVDALEHLAEFDDHWSVKRPG
jgi:pimeloyl-ACP methyl ester carboxylesterase